MSLSRRNFLKFGGATAAGVAVGGRGVDLSPVEAAATSLKLKEAKVVAERVPVLRGGLRSAHLRQGRQDHRHRGRSRHARTRWAGSAPRARRPSSSRTIPLRPTKALYRAPGSDQWEEKPLEWMYEQIAKRYYDTREKHFIEKEKDKDGNLVTVNRLEAIASLGSACIDNEECYLLSKLNRTLRASSTTSIRPESDTPPRSQLWGPRSDAGR